MNKLKDITRKQAIEIAKLAYGNIPDGIQSDFEFKYSPGQVMDHTKGIYEDSPEAIHVFFDAFTFGTRIENIRLIIFKDLNCSLNILRLKDKPLDIITINVSNQYEIQKKLREWDKQTINITPEEMEAEAQRAQDILRHVQLKEVRHFRAYEEGIRNALTWVLGTGHKPVEFYDELMKDKK